MGASERKSPKLARIIVTSQSPCGVNGKEEKMRVEITTSTEMPAYNLMIDRGTGAENYPNISPEEVFRLLYGVFWIVGTKENTK